METYLQVLKNQNQFKIHGNNKLSMNKTFIVNGNNTNIFKTGDVITNIIMIEFNDNTPIGSYLIEDIIPNGMSFLNMYNEYSEDENLIKYISDISGQKISFHVYYNGRNNPYIRYQTRVSGLGTYNSDGTIMKDYNNSIISYLPGSMIETK